MNTLLKGSIAALALAFTAAAAPALAKEDAPTISKDRAESIRLCETKLEAYIDRLDTRKPDISMERYYFNNAANETAIKTAIKTGKFEAERDSIGLWSRLQSIAAFNLVMNQDFHCAMLADKDGNLDGTQAGREQLQMYKEWTNLLVESSNKVHDIASKLKAEGDKLIANGTPPVKPGEPVFLFK